jgi:hypothetical protein
VKLPLGIVAERLAVGQAVLGREPARDVARRQALVRENVGGDLAGRQPDHLTAGAVPQGGVLPCASERTDHEGLARTGRGDEGLDQGAGGEDAADGDGLVRAQLDTGLGEPVEVRRGRGLVERRRFQPSFVNTLALHWTKPSG